MKNSIYIFSEKDLRKMKLLNNNIIDGILTDEEVTIFSAKPKVGKSTMVYDMARHIATGSYFLGRKINKANVIYYALDSNAQNMAYIAQQHKDKPIKDLEVRAPDFISLDEIEKDIIEWRYTQKKKNSRLLVVIDVLINVEHSTYNGKPLLTKGLNSYEDMMNLLQVYKHIASKYHVAILLIHHNNKSTSTYTDPFDNISGSSGIQGGLQNMLILERFEGNYRLLVRGRMLTDDEIYIKRDNGTFTLIDEEDKDMMIQETTDDGDLVRLISFLMKYKKRNNQNYIEGRATDIYAMVNFKNTLPQGILKKLKRNKELLEQHGIIFSQHYSNGKRLLKIEVVDNDSDNDEEDDEEIEDD